MKTLIALFLIMVSSVSAQTLKSIMESNKFIMAPVNFWTQQPYSGPFSNAVNAVVVHPEGGGGSNIFSTNYFVVTTNVFVEINTNFTSQTYYFVTNLVSVTVGGEQLWGTNTLPPIIAATGGITNKYAPVSVMNGPLYIGNEVHRFSADNTSWFYEGGVQILPGGASIVGTGNLSAGNGGWRINNDIGSAGQASFGHVNQYSSNYFQIITDSNGPPAIAVTLDGIVWVNHPFVVTDVQTNLAQAGSGVRIAVFDPNGKLYAGFTTNAIGSTNGGGGEHFWFTNAVLNAVTNIATSPLWVQTDFYLGMPVALVNINESDGSAGFVGGNFLISGVDINSSGFTFQYDGDGIVEGGLNVGGLTINAGPGNVILTNNLTVGNNQTNTIQSGSGVRIAVFDPNGKLYAGFATNSIGSTNITGSGFVLEYTTTSPIADGVFPTSSNSPSLAYKRGGLGTTFTWNTVTFTWE